MDRAVHSFLRRHKDDILGTWQSRVTGEERDVELVGSALRNDVPSLLDALADWLESDQPPERSPVVIEALKHVMQRLDEGLSLEQVFREYRLLRETIIEAVLGAEADEQDRRGASGEQGRIERIKGLARLNAGLDVVLSQSIVEFVAERDRRAADERARAQRDVRDSEERYRTLFETIDEGFCIVDVLFDEAGKPNDCRFVEVNPAFEQHTGLANARGKRIRELVPQLDERWYEAYGRVATTGESIRFSHRAEALSRDYDVYAFRVGAPEMRRVGVLFSDVSERKRAEESLREVNRQLRESDRRKSEFLAMLSHELRNPLAPIRNSIYLLERAAADSEQATRAREVVRRQTEHLTRLIDDLLDVTRISHGKIPLERSRVDLREIVRKTTDDLYSVFTQGGVRLRVDHVTAGPMWIEADSTRMAQVLTNLLNNSMKFTPSGGAVRVSVAAREGGAELCVTDDGVGMDPKQIEHMFEPFAQADHSLARTKGGLGLGLALVKSIVELHGGTVAAHSDGPGRGAEFLVRIPLADAAAESEKARHRSTGTPPRSILIIEDNVDGAQSLAEILELHGHRVRIARDGSSGIALARKVQPDVILCDIGLPDVDGYEVARTLRSDGPLRDTRLVALSGYAQQEDRQRARDAGFDAHLAKPVDLEALMSTLAKDS
ncbi:ATP-binding protein [Anaeromyxobacter sp. Fw109-5]|uniref:hybrid sensor histidine kinase/response regulator n=1 Tax=Anaeromyxobacter sp. (strain Fw109-5) TaxID=404589 RepID=UPI0000ED7F59|nr:ATP-binding protein [Anaeromyxobacter sp. Fw109-5]ABS25249.1 PAS/PAC sensor hybrid histidine kinase [Anaeromyxobacter sp. Fw109-5]